MEKFFPISVMLTILITLVTVIMLVTKIMLVTVIMLNSNNTIMLVTVIIQ